MSLVTKNIIHKYFSDFATGHYQIKYFGYGDLSEISQDEAVTYPLMWVQPVPSTISENMISYNYNVLIGDRITDGDTNDVEIESDSFQICLDLLSSIRNSHTFDWDLDKNSTATPFIQRFKDRIAGHLINVSILREFNYDECQIPESGSPAPLPSLCPAAVVTINSSTYGSAGSGTTTNIIVENTAGTDVGSLSGGNWLVPDATAVVKNSAGAVLDTELIPSGVSEDITVIDSDITINSAAFGSTPATVDLNIVVKDTLGVAVGSKVGSEWIVPAGTTTSGVVFKFPSGQQYSSYATGDEGSRIQAGWNNYTPPLSPSKIAQLDHSFGANFWWRLKTAITVNGVTSVLRFVDIDGGQTFSSTLNKNKITIDKLTGLGFVRLETDMGIAVTWANAVANALTFSLTVNGVIYSDFYLATKEELLSILGEQAEVATGYFQDPLTSAQIYIKVTTSTETWTSSTQSNSIGSAYSKGWNPTTYIRTSGKGSAYRPFYIFDARSLIS